ncbi:PEP-CTERM sorting domain-containing protein [Rubritalea tangerina]|uniref:PEP-CTERM sorting domain-containing protein n=1 Tax=Rubritalea tangerina TaxID=430798 RepID=A0ABW4ZG38_9BACT
MMKKTIHYLCLTSALLTSAEAAQAILNHTSADDVFIRESAPDSLQAERNIFGGQGAGAQFVTLMRFSLSELTTATSGSPVIIDAVSLDLGPSMSYSGISSSFTADLHTYTNFNASNATWNDPDGSGFADTQAGGSVATLLSQENFNNAMVEGSFNFSSSSAFVHYLQTAYDNGDSHIYLRLSNQSDTSTNGFLRTDHGSVTDTGNASLQVSYTAVPEPHTSALLGLAGLSLILRRKTR